MTTLRVLYVMLVLSVLALCVVWQSREVQRAGYCLERIQQEADSRMAEIQTNEAYIGKLKSPQRVTHLLTTLGLKLEQPAPPKGEKPDETAEQTPAHDQDSPDEDD